ncbi:MAG TPA: AAA family ATPase [Candidatus Binatia bacterium]|nr:AAA family ATPase [Candidatus Binatia bacterium]
MRLIGIAGTSGSGKDSLGDYLEERLGGSLFCPKITLSDLLRVKGDGVYPSMPDDELETLANNRRRTQGYDTLAREAVQWAQVRGRPMLVITSIRHPAEASYVLQYPTQDSRDLIWVDGPFDFRYARRASRVHQPGRPVPTYAQCKAQEERQFCGEGPFINLGKVRALVPPENHIWHDRPEKSLLYAQLDKIVARLGYTYVQECSFFKNSNSY